MARGNRREDIFHDDDDRRFFPHTLARGCEMTGWRVHAWMLTNNHCHHLFIQTSEPNLAAGAAGRIVPALIAPRWSMGYGRMRGFQMIEPLRRRRSVRRVRL